MPAGVAPVEKRVAGLREEHLGKLGSAFFPAPSRAAEMTGVSQSPFHVIASARGRVHLAGF